jgi:hypothetical protein
MDPFTLALATFGVQKLRGKSTKRALRDAALVGGGSYAGRPRVLQQLLYQLQENSWFMLGAQFGNTTIGKV